MVEVHPQLIEGNWLAGIALDFHTTSSTFLGHNESGHPQFDTTRPEIAELLYRLKYGQDKAAAASIVEAACAFLGPRSAKFDLIVPVPASSHRALQPVLVLAAGIAERLGKPLADCVTATRATAQLKNVSDPDERKKLVDGLYVVDRAQTQGRNVLLFDDLFRSGTTMNAIADVLAGQGHAASIRAFTITRTRSNR
jgi:predicted amidophosphoribosyltransferase